MAGTSVDVQVAANYSHDNSNAIHFTQNGAFYEKAFIIYILDINVSGLENGNYLIIIEDTEGSSVSKKVQILR